MKIHRFIGNPNDPEIAKQIRQVLKLRLGEQAIFSDGKGQDRLFLYQGGEKWTFLKNVEPTQISRKIYLYLAILKKENFELAVQKAVECGVAGITPVVTERTIKTGLNMERLEKIIKEACEQSGRSTMPVLSPILDFKDALDKTRGEKVIFHLNSPEYTADKNVSELSIFVGPEGGFTEKEIETAKNSGFTVASLGTLTLRGETAAIVATYRAVHGI